MIDNFRVLDLFSGAGGFSYGIDKNSHFRTLLALDFNENALKTFKHNMPEAETVFGDITDSDIKKYYRKKAIEFDTRFQICFFCMENMPFNLYGRKNFTGCLHL